MLRSLGRSKTLSGKGLRRNADNLNLGGIAAPLAVELCMENSCGGVEGGVSSSSEDEVEEVSKMGVGERDSAREGTFDLGRGRVGVAVCRGEKVPCG